MTRTNNMRYVYEFVSTLAYCILTSIKAGDKPYQQIIKNRCGVRPVAKAICLCKRRAPVR